MQLIQTFSKKILTLAGICLLPLAVMAVDQTEFNGDVKLKRLSNVDGNIKLINGKITLEQARVEGKLELVNGDIILQQSALVGGDIILGNEKQDQTSNNQLPLLRISADSRVTGKIILKQEVRLDIAKGASIGEIVELY